MFELEVRHASVQEQGVESNPFFSSLGQLSGGCSGWFLFPGEGRLHGEVYELHLQTRCRQTSSLMKQYTKLPSNLCAET